MRRAHGRALEAGVTALGLALLASTAARAQSAGEWRSSEQLWRDTCSYCHNDRVAHELRGTGLTPQAIASAVRTGPRAMPSFAPSLMSNTELAELARWLASQRKPESSDVDRSSRTPRHGSRDRPPGPPS